MSVQAKKRARSTVYFVVFAWQGKRVWERVGTDKREAQRLDALRKRELKDGTYVPQRAKVATTFAQWAGQWCDRRTTRSAEDETRWLDHYVLPLPIASMPLIDIRPRHVLDLVNALNLAQSKATGRRLTPKSVANIYGVVRTLLRDARVAELIHEDPCVLPRGTITRGRTVRREPYRAEEMLALTTDARIPSDSRVWNALAFYTGMREGEVCGRRWSHLDRRTRPLACLTVDTQYDDQPLKTDKRGDEHPRLVPVHPELAKLLAWWWAEGFEFAMLRKPALGDFIVPRRDGEGHTRSSAYKAFRRACAAAGVPNRSVHATRHTFITLTRRGGARKDVLERVTHNAAGDIVDAYTRWDWAPLCEAVLALDLSPEPVDDKADGHSRTASNSVEAPGIEPGGDRTHGAASSVTERIEAAEEPPSLLGEPKGAARCGASLPRRSGRPGPARVRLPDETDRLPELLEGARAIAVGDDVVDDPEAAVEARLAEAARILRGAP